MNHYPKLFFILPAVSSGILEFLGNFPHKTLVEVFCLWLLPIAYMYILLRLEMSHRARIGYIALMVITIGLAEYVSINLVGQGPMPAPLADWEWYLYRSLYLVIGVFQFMLFSILVLVAKSKTRGTVLTSAIIAVLMLIISWLIAATLADYRPWLLSPQLPLVLTVFLFPGYFLFQILRFRLSPRDAFVVSVVVMAFAVAPTLLSSTI